MKIIPKTKAGAALIESCLVIIMLCLILFGILQMSYLVAAKDVISYSAFTACRSATVGMKDEFVGRVVRTTSIPTAGPFVGRVDDQGLPASGRIGQTWDSALESTPSSSQFRYEYYAIPYYLGAEDEVEMAYWLSYYNWMNGNTLIHAPSTHTDYSVRVYVQQYVPLTMPFARAFVRGNMATMTRRGGTYEVPRSAIDAELEMENHSALYLHRP